MTLFGHRSRPGWGDPSLGLSAAARSAIYRATDARRHGEQPHADHPRKKFIQHVPLNIDGVSELLPGHASRACGDNER